jgi:hypothetical protein
LTSSEPSLTVNSKLIDEAERLVADGRSAEALDLLTNENRRAPDPHIEAHLVSLRQRAFAAPDPSSATSSDWPAPVEDVFEDLDGIPEVSAAEADATMLSAGLQHHGALLLRNLLEPETATLLLDSVRRAFDACGAAMEGGAVSDTMPWYVPFEADRPGAFTGIDRSFSYSIGAVLAVEAPRPLFRVIEAFKAARLGDLIASYLGEWPAISAKKTSLRRAMPTSPTEWHQDGAFLGTDIKTVNAWVALTPCGVDAPGIDVYARRFHDLVATGTDNALFSWSVSPEQAERIGTADVVRPTFAAGDALLFDQLTLHRTGISPEMTRDRYAIESWFFAPSTYPTDQIAIEF